ncbi:response regulator [Flavobacterium sp. Sd200]|uniref:hybrid sensor histidine kinase/response regulator transcription factor n=1 Tax=Flavobacterium sp. Sd200 TaxID=2692211 RepID=UPI00136F37A3|nr:ATP-binding protein [Flavobacterium sp. Sd200]MXN92381.1 response regulator [Flavobacterium sp. Sd200]
MKREVIRICTFLNCIVINGSIGCLIVILSVFFSSLYAQNIRTITSADGLPQSFVSGLVQDQDGFIWIGTRNGLSRYDGREFKLFQNKFNDTTSLASNIVIGIKRHDNDLWIEYESNEVDVMNLATEEITHFITPSIYKDASFRFLRRGWIVTKNKDFWSISLKNGVTKIDSNQKIIRYTQSSGLEGDIIRSIFEDSKKKIWVLAQHSLYRFNARKNRFEKLLNLDLDLEDTTTPSEVLGMLEQPDGTIIWGDRRYLYLLDADSMLLKKVRLTSNSPIGVKWLALSPKGDVFFEANGSIYNYNKKGITYITTLKAKDKSFAGCFLVDRSGLLWIGTNASGIYVLDFSAYFETHPYKENFAEDVWKSQFDLSAQNDFSWQEGNESLSSSGYHIRSDYDSKGRLWLALKQTVFCYNPESKQKKVLPPLPAYGKDLEKFRPLIKGITFIKGDVPIVADYNSNIFKYNANSDKWDLLLPAFYIRDLYDRPVLTEDIYAEGNRLWMTTQADGLLYVDLDTKKVHQLKKGLPTTHLLGIEHSVDKNLLWIGSYHGLICFNKKTFRSRVFSVSESLPDNTIYSILSDDYGYLWITTNKGLCRFDPTTFKTLNYTFEYGLQGNEFNRFHHLKLPNGKLIFGGLEGWSLFDPKSVQQDMFNTPVALTGLKVNNKAFNAAKYSNNTATINTLQNVTLTYNDNTLSFEFAGLQYNHPEDILYRYQLEGFDKDWIVAGNNNEAFYTKIPPGSYMLKVNASNTSRKWSRHIKTLQVIINPPWWATWWAYVFYAALAVLLIWLYIQYRIRQVMVRQNMLLKEKESAQLRELDEMKTRFFSNITHELRTPLTLILGPAEKLKQTLTLPQSLAMATTIYKNGEQLLGLTNQLLDLAKLEAGAMKPQLKKGNIAETLQNVIDLFREEANKKNIDLIFIKDGKNFNYVFAHYMLERIVHNLVGNAIKFTPQQGRVKVVLVTNGRTVTITVKDTGMGIQQSQLQNIFNRFYQADIDNSYQDNNTGTGIGLALVKEFTEVQGGTVTAANYEENNATGTIFTITLPYEEIIEMLPAQKETEKLLTADDFEEEFTTNRPLVLLVEDNQQISDFMIQNLEPFYKTYVALNGKKGLETALQLMPDFIISDVLMPIMDGFTLVQELKTDIRTAHIPIMLLTAKADFESKIEGLTYGADDYLTKPFSVTELLLRIKNHLNRQKKQREFIQQKLKHLNAAPLPQEESSGDIFLQEFYKILEDNLDNALLGVEEILPLVNMSRTSLHRKIKTITGMSTGELIKVYRLKRAAQFLRENYSSTEAAYKSGFSSPSYFTKSFREYYNLTPKEFINTPNG